MSELGRALDRGRMPFLRHLLNHERYRLRTMYSGLPSTTPAVQGELFYGKRQAVPAFAYLPQGAKAPVFMNDSEQARRVEDELSQHGAGLLAGGSAQSNIYTGDAAEPRFCASAMGWNNLQQSATPGARMLAAMAYSGTLLRAIGQSLLELGISIYDFAAGLLAGRFVRPELRIIPSRVVVGVLLRDAMTSIACSDVQRGLPVVQLNFLGYDEKAHCRGPRSRFAHYSLRGIDRCLRRLWKAAHASKAREYELWIYSDHGQEEVEPFERLTGRTIEAAVQAICSRSSECPPVAQRWPNVRPPSRAIWYTGKAVKSVVVAEQPTERPSVSVVAIGPLGYVYFQEPITADMLRRIAQRLVHEAQVPLVVLPEGEATIAFTPLGEWSLPRDAASVLGAKHPYLQAAVNDLVRLCRHPDAGQLLISGWKPNGTPVTFVQESGAHGSIGNQECSAFVAAPADSPIPWDDGTIWRPEDFRAAIQSQRSGAAFSPKSLASSHSARTTLRLMTYNVHSCRGMDRRLSPERIARVIAQCNVDIVALQELDVRRARSDGVDQARRIAEILGWSYYFSPAVSLAGDEHYGDAILSRLPMELIQARNLPGIHLRPHLEPRGALWVNVMIGQRSLQLVNTHLGLLRAERQLQVDALLGPDWLAHPKCSGPKVLCGDFNALPHSAVYRRLTSTLNDVQHSRPGRRRATFSSAFPLLSIDHIFVNGLRVISVESPRHLLARRASDHLPLVAELAIDVD